VRKAENVVSAGVNSVRRKDWLEANGFLSSMMTALSPDKITMLKGLLAASPDDVVRGLERAVCKEGSSGSLAAIGALIEHEVQMRSVRAHVLAPVKGLFRPRHADNRTAFPVPALSLLWKALQADKPDWVKQAQDACYYIDPDEPSPPVFDVLCSRAAGGLRAGDKPEYLAVVSMLEADRRGSTQSLILALDLAPIVRPPLLKLTDWLQRMSDERRASARIAYKDSGAAGEGGGPLMFEMLAAHLKHPFQILRVVSAIMDHPGERYLAASELAPFGERAIDAIEAQVTLVKTLRPGTGVGAAEQAAQAVQAAVETITELDQSVQLYRDGPWGQRVVKLKQGLASTVEQRLFEIEEAVALALPMQKLRYSARLVSTAPKLDEPPSDGALQLATGLLTFSEAVRGCANEGGFAGARSKVHETVGIRIDRYVEDVLEQIRLGDAIDIQRAHEFLDVAAQLMSLVRDRKAGGVVRRRAAAA
jgi:hypothetical protein